MNHNEARRIRALQSYGVLDTSPDAAFDRVTQLACDLFNAPIGLVSLIDEERQWFKSRQGLTDCSTPRSEAFCSVAIEQGPGAVMIVEDATLDRRFAHYPSVVGDMGVRFYVGAVLTSPEGYNLGTLCIIDTKPRPRPTDRELDRLRTLARIIVDELERMRVNRVRWEQARLLKLAETMSGVAHWRYDLVTGEVYWSDLLYEIRGADRRTYVPTFQSGLEAFHPDDQALVADRLADAIASKTTSSFQARMIRPDGEARVVQSKAGCELDEHGQVVALIGLFQDVTDQVRNLENLTASEARYRLLAENTSDVIVRCALDGTLLYVSPACRTMGYEPEDLVGTPYDRLVHPDDRERLIANSRPLFTGSVPDLLANRQHRYQAADGRWVWFEGNPHIVRDAQGQAREIVNVFRNITERKEQLELFENAFEHAPIGKCLVGLDGTFLKVNPMLCEMVGYSREEMLALNFQAITHPDDLDADLSLVEDLYNGRISTYRMDKRYIRKDGSIIWIQLAVSRVDNPDGSPRYFISQIEDLTARRAAEAALKDSEARYRLMAENTTDMILTAGLDGKITFVAASCQEVTGYAPAEVIGRGAADLAHPEERVRVRRVYRNLLKGGSAGRVRWRVSHKTAGREVWLESNPSLLRDPATDAPTGFLDVIRDVTAQVDQEEALAAARAEAEAAAVVKGEFMANMSHEIRTPLTAVIGFSGLLSQRPELDEVSQRYVQRVSSAGQALLAIVNDVLDFSKLEAGQVEITPRAVSPLTLAQDALALFAPQADDKGLWLECQAEGELPERVMIDPDRVRQVLLNLVGNAVKFTRQGAVRLFVAYDPDAARLRMRVEDTGEGMSVEQQTKLFQRFSQVDASSTRRHGGTGLGLAICKGLTEAMGGGIAVSSTLGEGAVFSFHIAAERATGLGGEAPALEPVAEAGRRLDGVRVLVVDDNFVNRELARTVLEHMGAEVAEAGDGRAALEAAALEPFDCILMDLRMPGLSGIDALCEIRDTPGPNQDVPILAFTAETDLNLLDLDHGFDGLVSKPIMAVDLVEAVDRFTRWDGVPDDLGGDLDLADLAEA